MAVVFCYAYLTKTNHPRKEIAAMTKQEAKVYIQYIKVLLAMKGYDEDVLNEALDMADYALDPEPVVPDPRFHWI